MTDEKPDPCFEALASIHWILKALDDMPDDGAEVAKITERMIYPSLLKLASAVAQAEMGRRSAVALTEFWRRTAEAEVRHQAEGSEG